MRTRRRRSDVHPWWRALLATLVLVAAGCSDGAVEPAAPPIREPDGELWVSPAGAYFPSPAVAAFTIDEDGNFELDQQTCWDATGRVTTTVRRLEFADVTIGELAANCDLFVTPEDLARAMTIGGGTVSSNRLTIDLGDLGDIEFVPFESLGSVATEDALIGTWALNLGWPAEELGSEPAFSFDADGTYRTECATSAWSLDDGVLQAPADDPASCDDPIYGLDGATVRIVQAGDPALGPAADIPRLVAAGPDGVVAYGRDR